MNIPAFLYTKLDKEAKYFHKSKGIYLLQQGLIFIIFQHMAKKIGVSKFVKWVEPSMSLKGIPEGLSDGGDWEDKLSSNSRNDEWYKGIYDVPSKMKCYSTCKQYLKYVENLESDLNELTVIEKGVPLTMKDKIGCKHLQASSNAHLEGDNFLGKEAKEGRNQTTEKVDKLGDPIDGVSNVHKTWLLLGMLRAIRNMLKEIGSILQEIQEELKI